MNNSVNILLQSCNWGSPFLISTVASQSSPKHLDFLVFCTSLWQNNKLKLKQYVWTPMPTERLILISSASRKIPPERCWLPLYRPLKIYTCEGVNNFPPLVSPRFFFQNFSPALYYLNAWNRLRPLLCWNPEHVLHEVVIERTGSTTSASLRQL